MKNKFYLLLLLPFFAFTLHKYHLSLTKVNFNDEKQSVQITSRYFIDDIERVVNKKETITLELATKIEHKNADSLLQNYLLEKLKIRINKKNSTLKYLGKEYEDDIVYFYLEIDSVQSISTITIENIVLLEEFDDQQNVIKLNINDKKNTFYLKNGNSINTISY